MGKGKGCRCVSGLRFGADHAQDDAFVMLCQTASSARVEQSSQVGKGLLCFMNAMGLSYQEHRTSGAPLDAIIAVLILPTDHLNVQ